MDARKRGQRIAVIVVIAGAFWLPAFVTSVRVCGAFESANLRSPEAGKRWVTGAAKPYLTGIRQRTRENCANI
jgi:hypothetical protein